MLRFLRRIGKLTDQYGVDQDALDSSLHQTVGAAAVQGRIALGPKAGAYAPRVGQGSQEQREFETRGLAAFRASYPKGKNYVVGPIEGRSYQRVQDRFEVTFLAPAELRRILAR